MTSIDNQLDSPATTNSPDRIASKRYNRFITLKQEEEIRKIYGQEAEMYLKIPTVRYDNPRVPSTEKIEIIRRCGDDLEEARKIIAARNKTRYTQDRKEYQKRYYQANKEKAKKYQREYNQMGKKKNKKTSKSEKNAQKSEAPREVVRTTFNIKDLVAAPIEKTLKMLEKIISGERNLTM